MSTCINSLSFQITQNLISYKANCLCDLSQYRRAWPTVACAGHFIFVACIKESARLVFSDNLCLDSIYRYSFKWFYPTNRPTKASMSTCTWKSSNWMIRPLISYGTSMIYDFLSSYGSKHWHFVSYILLVSLALLLFDKQILDRIICFHTKQNLKLDHKERYHNCWGPVDLC